MALKTVRVPEDEATVEMAEAGLDIEGGDFGIEEIAEEDTTSVDEQDGETVDEYATGESTYLAFVHLIRNATDDAEITLNGVPFEINSRYADLPASLREAFAAQELAGVESGFAPETIAATLFSASGYAPEAPPAANEIEAPALSDEPKREAAPVPAPPPAPQQPMVAGTSGLLDRIANSLFRGRREDGPQLEKAAVSHEPHAPTNDVLPVDENVPSMQMEDPTDGSVPAEERGRLAERVRKGIADRLTAYRQARGAKALVRAEELIDGVCAEGAEFVKNPAFKGTLGRINGLYREAVLKGDEMQIAMAEEQFHNLRAAGGIPDEAEMQLLAMDDKLRGLPYQMHKAAKHLASDNIEEAEAWVEKMTGKLDALGEEMGVAAADGRQAMQERIKKMIESFVESFKRMIERLSAKLGIGTMDVGPGMTPGVQ